MFKKTLNRVCEVRLQIGYKKDDVLLKQQHNLEYGDTKPGQLRYWLVKKYFLYACNQKT